MENFRGGQYNDRKAIDFRIAWYDMGTGIPRACTFPARLADMLFKYKFDDDRNNKYRRFIASPL